MDKIDNTFDTETCPVNHNDDTKLTHIRQSDGFIYDTCEYCRWIKLSQKYITLEEAGKRALVCIDILNMSEAEQILFKRRLTKVFSEKETKND